MVHHIHISVKENVNDMNLFFDGARKPARITTRKSGRMVRPGSGLGKVSGIGVGHAKHITCRYGAAA